MEENCKIEQHVTVLSENPKTGWRKEVNLVSWYGHPVKYDIRDWAPDHAKYGKGVTLSESEYQALVEFCKGSLTLEGPAGE